MNSIISEYERHLAALENKPFNVGLPEEKQRIRNHIANLKSQQKGRSWDGDLGCYDESPETEDDTGYF